MPPAQRMRRLILPHAFPMMVPAFGNQLIGLLKSTGRVSLINISDMTSQGAALLTTTLRTAEVFTWMRVLHFVMAYALTLGVRRLERRVALPAAGRGRVDV